MGLQLLGSLTPARFLSQYWQKKPLLVRQAIPAFAGIVQSSELFRLAARENVESKLFMRRGPNWSMHDGPHPRTAFARLPRTRWTCWCTDSTFTFLQPMRCCGGSRSYPTRGSTTYS